MPNDYHDVWIYYTSPHELRARELAPTTDRDGYSNG